MDHGRKIESLPCKAAHFHGNLYGGRVMTGMEKEGRFLQDPGGQLS